MTLQQQTLLPEQDSEQLIVYQGGSHASRTALQESVKRLLTSVTCGRNTGESLAKLSPDGLWLKMYQGYCQARMDGFFEEYSGTLPRWGLMLDGQLYQPQALEPYIDESGWRLLPTPVATDYKGGCWRPTQKRQNDTLRTYLHQFYKGRHKTTWPNPLFVEAMCGYPPGWTDLKPSVTP